MPETYTDNENTIMEPEYESYNTAVFAVDVIKQIAISTSREPAYKNNNAAGNKLHMLEHDLSVYKQTLVNIIDSVEACDGSDLDVFSSLSKDFEEAGIAFLNTGYALCDARKRFCYARLEEPVELVYQYLFQTIMNARSLLKDRHDRLSQAKAHKLALDESRKNLETLIENAYHTSGNADDISSVKNMIAEVGSSVS